MPKAPKIACNLGTNTKIEKTVAAQWFSGFQIRTLRPTEQSSKRKHESRKEVA